MDNKIPQSNCCATPGCELSIHLSSNYCIYNRNCDQPLGRCCAPNSTTSGCILVATPKRLVRMVEPTEGLATLHANALKAPSPACLSPIKWVMAVQRTGPTMPPRSSPIGGHAPRAQAQTCASPCYHGPCTRCLCPTTATLVAYSWAMVAKLHGVFKECNGLNLSILYMDWH